MVGSIGSSLPNLLSGSKVRGARAICNKESRLGKSRLLSSPSLGIVCISRENSEAAGWDVETSEQSNAGSRTSSKASRTEVVMGVDTEEGSVVLFSVQLTSSSHKASSEKPPVTRPPHWL